MSQTETKVINKETFEVIKRAVNSLVNTVKPTYGPAGNKVVISKIPYLMAVDDGVQIARDFELEDPAENAIVRLVKETAIKTNDRAGDGTTGALIMVQAIINEVDRRNRFDGRKIELELKEGLEEIKKQLTKNKREIKTKEDLKKAALVSFDNEDIAELLADTYYKLGKEATITIDKSPSMETYIETSEGITLKSGYISPYMVTNPNRMVAELENPYILITDYRITETNDILPIIDKLAKNGKGNLVIIAENVEQKALSTLIINLPQVMNPSTKNPGVFPSLAIAAPKMKDRKNFLEDLAILTGATMFTESKGNKLENADISDLGRADRIIAREDESIIVGTKGKKSDISEAISNLNEAIKAEIDPNKKKALKKRLAVFTNKLAVIKVGAATENEQKALKYKVEDAVNAVKSAYKEGVVPGSGLALARIKTKSHLLNEALKYPARQLRENMGMDIEFELKPNEAINAVTLEQGDFMEVGVMDPVEVLLAGVESAISIASILLTSSGMIVESVKKPPVVNN